MCGEKNSHSLHLGEAGQIIAQRRARHGVESRRRFIEEDERRAVQHGAGDGQLLLHASAPTPDSFVTTLPKTKLRQQLADARLSNATRQAPGTSVEIEVLVGGQPFIHAIVLQQRARARPYRVAVASGIDAKHFAAPLGRIDETQQHADHRCLPRAVRSEESEYDARRHVEGEMIQRPHLREIANQPFHLDRDAAHVCGYGRSAARTGAASNPSSLSGRAISSYRPGTTSRRSRFSRMNAPAPKIM